MEKNRILKPITPSNPSPASVIQKEKYNLFAPVAGNGQRGMAQFDTRDFKIDAEGKVSMSDNFLNMLAEALQEVNGRLISDVSIEKLNSNDMGNDYRLKFKLENEIEYICDFTAPRGLQGPQGERGLQGPQGERGPQGLNAFPNMSQNANKTIIVDGSVINGNWNATFIFQQGGRQRPICTQYTNHTGAKAEMLATANSAKVKFVNGSTDPQSYMEIFENSINFSKPITVQGKPIGGASKTILNIAGANAYMAYDIYFKIPIAGAKKITVNYTEQYNPITYSPEFANENVVIFDNGQPLSNIYFTLLTDDYSMENRVTLPLEWQNDDTFKFNFYTASGYQYGGASTTMLLTIEY